MGDGYQFNNGTYQGTDAIMEGLRRQKNRTKRPKLPQIHIQRISARIQHGHEGVLSEKSGDANFMTNDFHPGFILLFSNREFNPADPVTLSILSEPQITIRGRIASCGERLGRGRLLKSGANDFRYRIRIEFQFQSQREMNEVARFSATYRRGEIETSDLNQSG